jgi:hypothetical protein
MINVGEVVVDPDFAQEFNIYRTTGHFGPGGWIQDIPVIIPAYGVIYVASEKELAMFPEADRIKGSMAFVTPIEIMTTSADGGNISDELEWYGEKYRVINVAPWSDYGFYLALAERMKGS